jgi:uncharacterized membrane protein YraQ (UPF0718 family)
MKPLQPLDLKPCSCRSGKPGPLPSREEMLAERKRVLEAKRQEREARVAEALAPPANLPGKLGLTFAALVIWWHVYGMLPMFARVATQDAFGLDPASRLGSSVEFFLYDTPKVLMLLVAVVFGVGVLRSFFTPARTRRLLAGKNEFFGSVLAALLGTVTPFCSCSAVPLFMGFLSAGVPLGVTFAFLVSAPMVNEVALALLYSLLGWKVAALYAGTGLVVAIASGLVIGRMKLDAYVEDWVRLARESAEEDPRLTWADRLDAGGRAVRDIVGRVWPWVVAGIAVGAGIHGYVPDAALAAVMGREAWWSVPAAVVIGVPMYSNAAGIVPVLHALLEKGASLGTALAFMMSVIALSLPEAVILRKVLKPRLLAAFFATVGLGILLVGFLFNAIL